MYEKAKGLNPHRWSGKTRNWTPITEVLLNPKKHKTEIQTEFTIDTTTPIPRPKVSAMSEAVEQIPTSVRAARKTVSTVAL